MYIRVLRAVDSDLCQADEDELLVPNPVILADQDNDFFIGLNSRKPSRYGRVAAAETLDAEGVVQADAAAVLGATPEDPADEEREEDVRFMLDILSDFAIGALVGCRYTFEDDEISWEIFEVEDNRSLH